MSLEQQANNCSFGQLCQMQCQFSLNINRSAHLSGMHNSFNCTAQCRLL